MAEETGSCAEIAKALKPVCGAFKALGGADEKLWIGNVNDIATITFGADGQILTLTLTALKYLYPVIGQQLKNHGEFPTVDGDNIVLFDQSFSFDCYFKTSAERAAVQKNATLEKAFLIVNENKGYLTVWGINNQSNIAAVDLSATRFPLTTSGAGGTGTNINDSTAYVITAKGLVPNIPAIYVPAAALATNIAAIVALEAP